jgi:predicted DNA binding CopG/RHH family protein
LDSEEVEKSEKDENSVKQEIKEREEGSHLNMISAKLKKKKFGKM